MNTATIEDALNTLGDLLADRGHEFDLAVIGGGALLLLGLIERPTKDLDIVGSHRDGRLFRAEPMPPELVRAVREVGGALGLADDWLNAGPASLLDLGLPGGFLERLVVRHYAGLTIRIASREDHIAFKLYAAVDQGPRSKHFADLILLKPTSDELQRSAEWCCTHDPSSGFLSMLREALAAFERETSDE